MTKRKTEIETRSVEGKLETLLAKQIEDKVSRAESQELIALRPDKSMPL